MSLLKSRKFIFTAVTLLILIVAGLFAPNFTLDAEEATAYIVIIIGFVLKIAVDVQPEGEKWHYFFKDPAFWTAVVSLVYLILRGFQIAPTIPSEYIVQVAVAISTFILSRGVQYRLARMQQPVLTKPK